MNRHVITAFIAATAVAGFTTSVVAGFTTGAAPAAGAHPAGQTNEGTKATGDDPGTDAQQSLLLARQLFDYGQQNKDVVAMLTAAKIEKAVEPPAGTIPKDAPTALPGATAPAVSTGGATKPIDAAGMFAAATAAAGSDATLLGLIQQAQATQGKGFIQPGGLDDWSALSAGWKDTWRPGLAVANQLATVSIAGDGSSDLDLYVFDENNNQICDSTGHFDHEYCSWTPAWTGPFYVVVRNEGHSTDAYDIWTN